MGTQVEGWNSNKVLAKRLSRPEGPVIQLPMSRANFIRFGEDIMVYIENTPDIKMSLAHAVNELKREFADTRVEFDVHWPSFFGLPRKG